MSGPAPRVRGQWPTSLFDKAGVEAISARTKARLAARVPARQGLSALPVHHKIEADPKTAKASWTKWHKVGRADHGRLRRYSLGDRPTTLRKETENELVSANPTWCAISVTDRPGWTNKFFAQSIRRLI